MERDAISRLLESIHRLSSIIYYIVSFVSTSRLDIQLEPRGEVHATSLYSRKDPSTFNTSQHGGLYVSHPTCTPQTFPGHFDAKIKNTQTDFAALRVRISPRRLLTTPLWRLLPPRTRTNRLPLHSIPSHRTFLLNRHTIVPSMLIRLRRV